MCVPVLACVFVPLCLNPDLAARNPANPANPVL
jgi:hypothetical protein